MRSLTLALAVLTLAIIPVSAHAEDGFGSYFYNQGSAGFGNPIDKSSAVASNSADDGAGVAAIEPAAGDETPAASDETNTISNEQPVTIKIDRKKNAQDLKNIQNEIENALSP